eukprot:TRINITY_DN1391_c0_g2_i3.p1 TRINITY_DN1391_c0_g2~~TRINITY_DN1391_c0_g2_i3.p1  ORF type:complete len:234 (+),score=35.46 TRINITY_DN1391_c0_g2_i3:702-1403(+)
METPAPHTTRSVPRWLADDCPSPEILEKAIGIRVDSSLPQDATTTTTTNNSRDGDYSAVPLVPVDNDQPNTTTVIAQHTSKSSWIIPTTLGVAAGGAVVALTAPVTAPLIATAAVVATVTIVGSHKLIQHTTSLASHNTGKPLTKHVAYTKTDERSQGMWQADDSRTNCAGCHTAFGGYASRYQRHHCRLCGGLYCGYCATYASGHTIQYADSSAPVAIRTCKTCALNNTTTD